MKPLKPLPHQAEAVSLVVPGLRKHGRGQVIMACGTGKTLIGPLVADKLGAKTQLVFVPSLLLARQLLNVYRRQWPQASYLAVCSDIDKVATEDAPAVDDVGCEATTDSRMVGRFLKARGRRVVIATYQSGQVLHGRKFDFAVFDEAHRTAGAKGKPFAFGLHDKNIRCEHRLFMTATPRHAEIVSEEGETEEVYSMDDSAVYGPELHKLSFRKAIDLGLIVNYRIVVSVFKLPKNPGATATQIALRQAMSRYGASKVFTFHNTIAKAATFIESASALRGVHLSHVNGMQPNAERALALREFAKADQAIMSNVRCLTEGVDLPSCDMVAFMDPKESMVEIVQAIGRAMRTSPGKKRALIFLPIFVQEKDGEDLEAATRRTGFAKLHEILQAVQEQDETMAARLGEIRSGERTELPENVELNIEEESFRGASQGVVERIRKYVTVRMLKPFKFGMTAQEKDKELFRMAQAQLPRPRTYARKNVREVTLGHRLLNLQKQRNPTYLELIRICPMWHNARWTNVQSKDAELLRMAKEGSARPTEKNQDNEHTKALARRLRVMHNSNSSIYAEIIRACPAWDPRMRRQLFIEKILTMIAAGKSVRALTRKERSFLIHLLAPPYDGSDRHLVLKTQITKAGGVTWLPQVGRKEIIKRRDEADKLSLIQWAEAGKKPYQLSRDPEERRLSSLFWKLINPKNRKYDVVFTQKMKQLAPLWFVRGSSMRMNALNEIRELIKAGVRVSYSKVRYYVAPSSPGYDSAFRAEIAKTSPQSLLKTPMSSKQKRMTRLAGRYMGMLRAHRKGSIIYRDARGIVVRDGVLAGIEFLLRHKLPPEQQHAASRQYDRVKKKAEYAAIVKK
jgi:superfamily II DNA or RNA helicase